MVRILQITGVAALICTGLVLASIKWPARLLHLGITQDHGVREFLEEPGAVTRFNTRNENQVPDNQDKTPLLVRQAQTLEGIINPREPQAAGVPVPSTITRGPATPPPPPQSSAKFELFGISYSPSDPTSSLAYIRLPDNTYEWVMQGSEIGHMVIKQVKNDSIICFDGQRMSEMKVEPAIDTASILETGAVATTSDRITDGGSPLSPRLTGQDAASLNELVQRLKQELQKDGKSDQAGSNATPAEKAAAAGKLITEYKSSRVSPEEAKNLETLGEQLNGAKDNQQMEEKRRELMRRLGQPRSPQP
jgi:hypothetical protein